MITHSKDIFLARFDGFQPVNTCKSQLTNVSEDVASFNEFRNNINFKTEKKEVMK